MENPLITHAINHVWCEPGQDHQHTIHACRLTDRSGIIRQHIVAKSTVLMPKDDLRRFHVYQLGRIPASNVGLALQKNKWYNVADLLNQQKTVIDIYLACGGIVPAHLCFLQQLADTNFVLAVATHDWFKYGTGVSTTDSSVVVVQEIANNDLFIRFYKNARYDATSWLGSVPVPLQPLAYVYCEITKQSDYADFMSAVSDVKTRYSGYGAGLFYENGLLCDAPIAYRSTYLGKLLSFRYDESIKGIYDQPLRTTTQFDSNLDFGLSKYLVLTSAVYDVIDYCDDVDFYLINAQGYGLLIARTSKDTVRMVTHNAYALRAGVVNAYTRYQNAFSDIQTLKIKTVVRQGGMLRGATNVHSRVDALYRLPLGDIQRALAGVTGGPAIWRASALEASFYSQLMSTTYGEITKTLVNKAYGYHAASKIIFPVHYPKPSNNQLVLDNGYLQVSPTGTTRRVNVYAYREGVLVSRWVNASNNNIVDVSSAPSDCDTFEVLPVTFENLPTDVFENQNVTSISATHYGFRCYVCSLDNGVPDNRWLDVTDGYYHQVSVNSLTEETTVTWDFGKLSTANLYPAVRVGGRIKQYVYTPVATNYSGWMSVTLVDKIPSGTIDVFMNGESLIRGIDFTIAWPTLYIVKTPNRNIDDVEVLIRHYGFCSPVDMLPLPLREVGFVRDGMVSVDGIYQVRNQRTGRAIVGGKSYPVDTVKTDDHNGLPMVDGRPYALCDYVLPIEFFSGGDSVTQYLTSADIDQQVDQYLTRYLNTQPPAMQFIQGQRWEVYSPFMGGVIDMVLKDAFADGRLALPYNRTQVDVWLNGLHHLLPHDPCVYQQHDDFIVIYAHSYVNTVSVTVDEYRFLEYVNRYYLHERIDITPSVTVG